MSFFQKEVSWSLQTLIIWRPYVAVLPLPAPVHTCGLYLSLGMASLIGRDRDIRSLLAALCGCVPSTRRSFGFLNGQRQGPFGLIWRPYVVLNGQRQGPFGLIWRPYVAALPLPAPVWPSPFIGSGFPNRQRQRHSVPSGGPE